MVLASAQIDASCSLLGPVPQPLALRVCGSEHDGFVMRLRSPKCTVGSDPTCTLRLLGDEIRPFHCLILRGVAGTFVRRWSAGTTLNGAGFDLAPLHAGDRLRIGAVELEVLPESLPDAVPTPACADATDRPLAELVPDGRVELEILQVQSQSLTAENDRLRQALVAQEAQAQRTEAEYREQLASLRGELTVALAAGVDQRTAQAELVAKAEVAVAQIVSLHDQVSQLRGQLEQQHRDTNTSRGQLESELRTCQEQLVVAREQLEQRGHEWAATRGQLAAELDACRQQLAATQSQHAELDRSAVEQSQRELAACRDMAANLRAELDQSRSEQAEQRNHWLREREQLEADFADSLASAQARSQSLEEELRAIRAEVERWQQDYPQRVAKAAAAMRPVMTEVMPSESPGSTLALDPCELTAAAQEAAQRSDAVNDLVAPAITGTSQPGPTSPLTSAEADSIPHGPAGEDDESEIQRYMERLLRRVGTTPGQPDMPVVEVVAPAPQSTPVAVPIEPLNDAALSDSPKRRESVSPEAQQDLVAMRELAQRSTRLAITHSDRRLQLRAILGEVFVAGVCLVLGILAAALSRTTFSVETIGGAIGISFGLVLSARAVHRISRLRKHSAVHAHHADL